MKFPESRLIKSLAGPGAWLGIVLLGATGPASAAQGEPGVTYSLSATPFHQPDADMAGGGEFDVTRALLRFQVSRPVSRSVSAGVSLKYDRHAYDFTNPGRFGDVRPWDDVERFGVGIPLFMRLEKHWTVGATPSVDWLREDGAALGDAVSYGTVLFAFRSFGGGRRIGFGAGIFHDVDDDTRTFPLLAVDWRFDEHWRLANPFDAEALGPAGLELSYAFNEDWRLGGGAVYRSTRFRLDGDGLAPGGVGKEEGIVGFLRLHRSLASGFAMDLYIGAVLDGRLEVDNNDGVRVASSDYDRTPFAAMTVSTEF